MQLAYLSSHSLDNTVVVVVRTVSVYLQDEQVPVERRGVRWALLQRHPYVMGFCLVVVSSAGPHLPLLLSRHNSMLSPNYQHWCAPEISRLVLH